MTDRYGKTIDMRDDDVTDVFIVEFEYRTMADDDVKELIVQRHWKLYMPTQIEEEKRNRKPTLTEYFDIEFIGGQDFRYLKEIARIFDEQKEIILIQIPQT